MEKRPQPQPPERVAHGPDELRRGIERLRRQIGELEAFDPSSVTLRSAAETRAMQSAIAETLAKTFGEGTSEYNQYASAAQLDHGPLYISARPPVALVVEWIRDGKARSLALLNQAVSGLQGDLAKLGEDAAPVRETAEQAAKPSPSEPVNTEPEPAEGQSEPKVKTKTQDRKKKAIVEAEGKTDADADAGAGAKQV
jgi:hypothetical protein